MFKTKTYPPSARPQKTDRHVEKSSLLPPDMRPAQQKNKMVLSDILNGEKVACNPADFMAIKSID